MNEVKTIKELMMKLDLVILGSQGLSHDGHQVLTDYGQGCLDMAIRVRKALEKIEQEKEPSEITLDPAKIIDRENQRKTHEADGTSEYLRRV